MVSSSFEPDLLDWIVLRVLDEFGDRPPSSQEAAAELGILDVKILHEIVERLVRTGTIQRTDTKLRVDLERCRITDLGRQLLREGRVAVVAEHHGLRLHLDPMTGEHSEALPRKTKARPDRPVIPIAQLPERVRHLGLERVWDFCRRQKEPFVQGDAEIRGADVVWEDGSYLWVTMCVTLEFTRDGVLHARLQGTASQQAWLEEHGLNLGLLGPLDAASTTHWADGRCHNRLPSVPAANWISGVDRLVTPADVIDEAKGLVNGARSELVLHAGWLDAGGMGAMLARAAQRGVRCYVCGESASLEHWTAPVGRTPGFVASGGSGTGQRPLALVADRSRSLHIERIQTVTSCGENLEVEVAAVVKPAAVDGLRDLLLVGVPADLNTPDPHVVFACFALDGDLSLWEQGVHLIQRQRSGIERAADLHLWAEWGRRLAPEPEPAEGWLTAAARAWWDAFGHARDAFSDDIDDLLQIADGLVLPVEILARLTESIDPVPVTVDSEPLCELVTTAGTICHRWRDFRPLTACPAYRAKVQACLSDDDPAEDLRAVMRRLETEPAYPVEGHRWAAILSASLPQPTNLTTLAGWLEAHEPMHSRLGNGFQATARRFLRRCVAGPQSHGDRHNQRLESAWLALGLPRQELPRLNDQRTSRPAEGRRHT
ncbi:MAG: hypothetical protein CL908_21060 [Deltaproteobacteria bacterium]|nr:hypothetical protein [Deltaproteobacteria bacterium]